VVEGLAVVILAGGLSTRFKSKRSKLMHQLAGRPILGWVLEAVAALEPEQTIVVHGKHNTDIVEHFQGVDWALQPEPLGTADALLCGIPALGEGIDSIFLISGDSPLISSDTLGQAWLVAKAATGTTALVLTADTSDPAGYGRVIKNGYFVEKIVEHKDCTSRELEITEVNSGMYFLKLEDLENDLRAVGSHNASGEMYLTDVIGKRSGMIYKLNDFDEMLGINTRCDLAQAEAIIQKRITTQMMMDGVSFIRPEASYIEIGASVAPDTIIYPGSYVLGHSTIGEGCKIGPNTVVDDCVAGDDCTIIFSQLHRAKIGNRVKIGPYCNVRPDTVIEDDVKLGDFVEIKKTLVRKGAKIPHLSYVGDSEIGEKVNIGAGTITCNYDGFMKHPTIIEDGVFVGSNSTIIAPCRIGSGAYVAAGSVITQDVPDDDLAVGRGRQVNKKGYAKRIRKNLERRSADEKSGREMEGGS